MHPPKRPKLSLVITAVLLLPAGGCAQLKALRAENASLKQNQARLEAQLGCCGDEKERLALALDQATTRADEADAKVADALAQAEGQRQRAIVLAEQVALMQAQIDRLDAKLEELLEALEKAWSRRGRSRNIVDDLIKLDRSGADVRFSYDACNGCAGSTAAGGS